jgi:hypothetical protein
LINLIEAIEQVRGAAGATQQSPPRTVSMDLRNKATSSPSWSASEHE